MAQSNALRFTATIQDAESKIPISYVTVFNASQQKGTTTNSDGYFELNEIKSQDIIIISLVGYKTEKVTITKNKINQKILLRPQGLKLNEVKINTGNPYLFEIIKQIRKSRPRQQLTAKSYYNLASYVDSNQVEFLEGYYNSELRGLDIDSLHAKQIRFALRKNKETYFLSPNTSLAFTLHGIFRKNEVYPKNPLELNKRLLKKNYSLFLFGQYKNEAGDSIYVIDFVPIRDTNRAFSGKIWVNTSRSSLIKISLEINNASIYPFRALKGDKMDNVRLNITKTFQNNSLESVVLDYDFRYIPTKKPLKNKQRVKRKPYRVNTKSFVYVYNPDQQFTLPFFNYSYAVEHRDYGQASALPFNYYFWSNINEFKYEKEKSNQRFIKEVATINNIGIAKNGMDNKLTALIQPNYIPWSKDYRIKIFPDSLRHGQREFLRDRYDLKAQIYLDINNFNDSTHIITATYCDPFNTFYNLPINNSVLAFTNIYFDLMEIERRKLEKRIEQSSKSIDSINKLYARSTASMDSLSNIYIDETKRGTDYKALTKYNEYVWKELSIDNILLFNVEEPKE